MKKSIKYSIWFAGISGVLYWGFWIYRVLKAEKGLIKTAPKYIENIFSEKLVFSWNFTVTFPKVIIITLNLKKCPPKIMEKQSEVESVIRDYLKDYFPLLRKAKFSIKFQGKTG